MEDCKLTAVTNKHVILCTLHEINFDDMDNTLLSHGFYESDQPDFGLALHELKEKVKEINAQLSNQYLVSIEGFHSGKTPVKTKPVNMLNIDYVHSIIKNSREVN